MRRRFARARRGTLLGVGLAVGLSATACMPGRGGRGFAGAASSASGVHGVTGALLVPPLLRANGRTVMRWPSRVDRPLAVWIANPAGDPDALPDDRSAVERAVAAWGDIGLPVRIALVSDSASADITIGWTDHLAAPLTGHTDWQWDAGWWVTHAYIILAHRHADRTRVEGAELRAIALHEIGHALGLGHASDSASVMAPYVVARDLTTADVRAARLLYTLTPGRR